MGYIFCEKKKIETTFLFEQKCVQVVSTFHKNKISVGVSLGFFTWFHYIHSVL